MIKLCVIRRDNSFIVVQDELLVRAQTPDNVVELMGYLGVEAEEVRTALQYLRDQDDDYAEFGINKTFIFTDKFKISA